MRSGGVVEGLFGDMYRVRVLPLVRSSMVKNILFDGSIVVELVTCFNSNNKMLVYYTIKFYWKKV